MVLASACTTLQNGTAAPSPTDSVTTPAPQLPGAGVPGVAIPIDTTQFQRRPCTTLTDAQIAELLGPATQPKPEDIGNFGVGCSWHPTSATQAAVSVIYATKNQRGLTAIYEQKGTTFPLFIPMDPIDGYPAVAYGQADLRAKGKCAIALGTSDQEIVDVSIALSEGKIDKRDPCAAARDVTATVLNNLRTR
ncbi:DUF3558 domain-containing protein [Amycolatopsis sp. lyj-109]|uniref:DUF3558 domain-containing protein n=1 Tax=Amycolatopsis sp. lyj-109 TaxID=2789287 RepID=UPI00397D82E5